jgi:2-dehydro-3-deoxy-D-arabinonate dehydratase
MFVIKLNNELLFWDGDKKFTPCLSVFPSAKNFTDLLKIPSSELLSKANAATELTKELKFEMLVDDQYIMATGCTYNWSEEKLKSTEDQNVYKGIYLSERPMLFMKGRKENCASTNESIGLRHDSSFTIPEAELVAVFNSHNEIIGYTLGNDVTALDFEKENPLYQAQAKFYKGSVSLLPVIKLTDKVPLTTIHCRVIRDGKVLTENSYSTKNLLRNPSDIVKTISRSGLFTNGGFLFLGCDAGYSEEHALKESDIVEISADLFKSTLINPVRTLL